MYSKINYTIVGLFVVILTATAAYFGFWLLKYDNKDSYKLYKIYFNESVNGLTKDSTVKYKGVEIGRVAKISIDKNDISKVVVLVKIKSEVPIKEDMRAHLEMVGITGLLTIIIDGGSNNSKNLVAKNGEIPVIKSTPSWLVKTKNSFAKLNENLNNLLQKAQKLLSSKNIENIDKTLENLKNLSIKANKIGNETNNVLKEFNSVLKETKIAIKNIDKNFAVATKDFNSFVKTSNPAIERFKVATNNFNSVVLKVKKGLKRGDYNLKRIFEPLNTDIHIISVQLREILRRIDNSPSDIIFKSRKMQKGPGE